MLDAIFIFLQWPAMAITLLSSCLVTSQSSSKRAFGFWCFMLCNVLWILCGWQMQSYALVCLQLALLFLNIRGVYKNLIDN